MTDLADLDWSGRHVLVVGDLMLDRFVYGEVNRISPEAPIPVLLRSRQTVVAGGAANVARNVVALGGRATLVGAVGRDLLAQELRRLCEEGGIATHFATSSRQTTEKTRFVAGGQHILRADAEDTAPLLDVEEAVCAGALEALDECDVLVLSDYAKGVLTPKVLARLIAAGRALHVPVVVDPKLADLSAYAGATVLTPNRRELAAATGREPHDDASAAAAGATARDLTGAEAILVTRGADGMTLVEASGASHLPSVAREVFDVSGAGDTVVACLALALAAGAPLRRSAEVANVAAGLVVSKLGTATVTREELAHALDGAMEGGVLAASWDAAVRVREAWRARALKVGFTNGCFDLLHPGHVHILRQAREACDRLIVGLNGDASVRALKGPERPVRDVRSRAEVLAALRMVDLVVAFEERTPRALIETLAPDVLVKGADYARDQVVGADVVEANGGRVVLVDLLEGHSTTATVEALRGLQRAS